MIHYDYYIRVYYRDVDQMGIVYYTRYLEYFEAARTELLRSVGLDVTKIEQLGYFLPVISCHCDYKMSAKFDDELHISTKNHFPTVNNPILTFKTLFPSTDSLLRPSTLR